MRALIVAVILLAASPSWVDAQCVGSACFSGSGFGGFGGFRSRTVIKQTFHSRPMRFRQRQVVQSVPVGFATGYEVVQFQAAPLVPVVEYAPPVTYVPQATYATPQAPTKAPPVPQKAPPLPSKNEPVPSAQIGPREP